MSHAPRRLLSWLAATGLAMGTSLASAQIAFTDVTAPAGVTHLSESYGASFGDLDGDGYLDIFSSNHRTRPSLLLNMGDGTFFDTGPQVNTWLTHPNADTHGGSFADFENDGDQDLIVSTGTGNLSQVLVNQNGRLVDKTVALGVGITNLGGRLPVFFDYDGDHRLDFVVTQYGGIAKLFHQNTNGTFTETTSTVKLLCKRFHYGQLFDVNGDGRLDFLCPDEALFPQKIFDTGFQPWKKLFDNATPTPNFPIVKGVADSAIADFNNDGKMDMFILSGVQLRPSSVVQAGPYNFESLLTGGTKGFKFICNGQVTFNMDWNKADEGNGTDITKIMIGATGQHPNNSTFTLDPTDPNVVGMPPPADASTKFPIMQIGFDPNTKQWTLVIQTKLTTTSANVFSEAYIQASTTAPVTNLVATGLWAGDKPARPTLLINNGSGFSDNTVAAGLGAPIQCVSATAGDFDNDMWVDLYLACRTGASNIANILYHNNGNGTFTAVPDAGGAAGPIGIAMGSGAGTADSVISGDYDVDGFLDLFVTNGFNLRPLYIGGPNKLYHNNGNSNHWIELDLVGTHSDREATGARLYATANGITQLRVQNGGYHRWSQDAKRSHFGLAGASAVDLKVMWPSGAVENYPAVAADQLYRITEGSGIAPVALGIAPAYPCGPPALDGTTDSGVFIWRDCPSGQWRMRTAAAGGNITYSGKVTSSTTYTSVAGVALSGSDVVDYSSNPKQIVFSLNTQGGNLDGINFLPQDGSNNCLKIDAPSLTQVYYGPFRTPVTQPFDLDTQGACVNQPSELAVSPVTVSETAGQANFTVTLTPASAQTVTVNYSTSDGTAIAGQDYTAVSGGTVTFNPGETSKNASVTILDDSLAEGNETFSLTISNPVNAVLTTATKATGTIQDNEISPCGTPSYNAGLTAALFVWKDCTSGKWTVRATAGGSAATIAYTGSVQADAPFASVAPYSIESFDTFNSSTPGLINFIMKVNTTAQDGFSFTLAPGGSACFSASAPGGAQALLGSGQTSVPMPFRLDTLGPC